jgi:hypothetical protein
MLHPRPPRDVAAPRPTTRRRTALPPALAALALAACASSSRVTGPVDVDGVRVAARRGTVVVENGTPTPVFVTVIGRETSALVDLYFCVAAARCPGALAPGATLTVAWPRRIDERPEREAIVYWWRAGVGPDGRPGAVDIHNAVIGLR